MTVKYGIKKYLLGKDSYLMSQKSNVEEVCDTNKLVDPLMAKDTPKTECNMTKSNESDHESLDDEIFSVLK